MAKLPRRRFDDLPETAPVWLKRADRHMDEAEMHIRMARRLAHRPAKTDKSYAVAIEDELEPLARTLHHLRTMIRHK